jgi:hypothetical protein
MATKATAVESFCGIHKQWSARILNRVRSTVHTFKTPHCHGEPLPAAAATLRR